MLKTWDIFDTLIARRCVVPHIVFQIMEQKTRLNGFTQARIAAEQNILRKKPNITLDDIYDEFLKIVTNATLPMCEDLKNFEIPL